jgi:hypothetical protein
MPVQVSKKINKKDVYSYIYNGCVYKGNLLNGGQEHEVIIDYPKDQLTTPVNAKDINRMFIVNATVFRSLFYQPINYFKKFYNNTYNIMFVYFHQIINHLTMGSIYTDQNSINIILSLP